VLGHVGERLGDDEVGGRLDRGRQPADVRLDRHGHRASGRERRERRVQAAVGQDRRVDAADELAQLREGRLRLLVRLVEQAAGRLGVAARELVARHAEVERERDEPSLDAVVEVALEAAPLLLLRPNDRGAALLELAHTLTGPGREEDAGEERLRLRQRGSDPRCRHEEQQPRGEHHGHLDPAVDPVLVPPLGQPGVGKAPPPGRVRDGPEHCRPEDERHEREREPDDREHREPADVLPGLHVARQREDPPPEARLAPGAVALLERRLAQERDAPPLEPRDPARGERSGGEDRDPDERDHEREPDRHPGDEDDEGGDRHEPTGKEVQRLAPRREAEGAEDDRGGHARTIRRRNPSDHPARRCPALRLTPPRRLRASR